MVRPAVPVVFAALALAGAAGAGAPRPSLAIVDRQPVVVRGAHFGARELVRVTALANGTQTLRVRATQGGTFVATFRGVALGRCAGLRIRAVGARGHVAAVKLPLPACLPVRAQ